MSEWKKRPSPTGKIENLQVRIRHGVHLGDKRFETVHSWIRPLEMNCLRVQLLLVLILQLLLDLRAMLTQILPLLRREVLLLRKDSNSSIRCCCFVVVTFKLVTSFTKSEILDS